jgi:hypothetical protein
MKNWKNFKTFQSRIYQKTSNKSKSALNAGQLSTGIDAKMNELSGDMLLVAEHLVLEEIFSIYPVGTHGFSIFKWVTHGRPMQCSALDLSSVYLSNIVFNIKNNKDFNLNSERNKNNMENQYYLARRGHYYKYFKLHLQEESL